MILPCDDNKLWEDITSTKFSQKQKKHFQPIHQIKERYENNIEDNNSPKKLQYKPKIHILPKIKNIQIIESSIEAKNISDMAGISKPKKHTMKNKLHYFNGELDNDVLDFKKIISKTKNFKLPVLSPQSPSCISMIDDSLSPNNHNEVLPENLKKTKALTLNYTPKIKNRIDYIKFGSQNSRGQEEKDEITKLIKENLESIKYAKNKAGSISKVLWKKIEDLDVIKEDVKYVHQLDGWERNLFYSTTVFSHDDEFSGKDEEKKLSNFILKSKKKDKNHK